MGENQYHSRPIPCLFMILVFVSATECESALLSKLYPWADSHLSITKMLYMFSQFWNGWEYPWTFFYVNCIHLPPLTFSLRCNFHMYVYLSGLYEGFECIISVFLCLFGNSISAWLTAFCYYLMHLHVIIFPANCGKISIELFLTCVCIIECYSHVLPNS